MYPFVKRLVDVSLSAGVLLALLPIWALLVAWIRMDSVGPALYRGTRIGRGGQSFPMLKFRTMRVDADQIGGPSTAADDARITRAGKWLRRTKLDELPQLVNVLRGDMSLVGPRPEVVSELSAYAGEFAQILSLRPGITDWASIWNVNEGAVLAGARDPHQAYREIIQPTKLLLQLKYAREIGFWTDARILMATLRRVLDPDWTPRELAHVRRLTPVRDTPDSCRDST